MHRWRVHLFVLVVVGMLVGACGDSGSEPATTAAGPDNGTTATTAGPSGDGGGGTVRVGWGGAPVDLNPGNGVLAEDYTLYEIVYDTPVGLDLDGNYVPELATDWSVSADGLTWTMTIRPDAVFHDGLPLTAEDVAFTIQLYRDTPDFPFLPSYPDAFVDIQAPDPTTVVLTTEEPIGNFESRMVFMYVIPKHIWEAESDAVAFANDAMIGSGSFRLAEYKQGEFVRLEANGEYWGGSPNVDEVVFQTFDNPDARVQALINGDVDMITEFPNTAIATLRNDPNITVAQGDPLAPSLSDIIFNVTDPENCPVDDGGVCSGHPALADLSVRQALAHGVDKQQLIDIALLGLGAPGLGLVPTGLGDWFASELVPDDYAFDLAAGNRLLDDAGYADSDGDGVRECPDGADCGPTGDLTFRWNYPTDSDTAPRVAELVQGWWAELGVKTEIQGLDPDTLTSVCCPTFDYDVIQWGWGSDPDPGFLLAVLLTDEIASGFSESGYSNPAYDDLYAQQAVATDRSQRRELIVEMQRIALEDVPYIITWYDQATQAYRNDRFVGWRDDASRLALEDPTSLNVIRPAG
jgi:peptide/nickel transport system substrate-binding protein